MLELVWCDGVAFANSGWLQNLISHRGKALAKLKAWLAGAELES
jgi:hypothetical protein